MTRLFTWLKALWRGFWDRAPRQLRFTREGRVLVALAFAIGFAAVNTGNNLLYFGWGLVLSGILLSGVLSEATLRPLRLSARRPLEARAGETAVLPLAIENTAGRLPAFGVEAKGLVRHGQAEILAWAPYQLRLAPKSRTELVASFVPERRGRHTLATMVASTSYPFGFFVKSRRFREAPLEFWVVPRRVPVAELVAEVRARLGEAAAGRAGAGDEYFSLRPYRAGDDLRRVHWPSSARTGRWVVVETEACTGSQVLLELAVPASAQPELVEHGIATLGSLAEELLAAGLSVGVRAPGILLQPATGTGQRRSILFALARLEPGDQLPPMPRWSNVARVAVACAATGEQ